MEECPYVFIEDHSNAGMNQFQGIVRNQWAKGLRFLGAKGGFLVFEPLEQPKPKAAPKKAKKDKKEKT